MSEKCFGLIGGLGVGAAIHYYRELAKAHDKLHLPMNLAMVHADMARMVRWAETGDAKSMGHYGGRDVRRSSCGDAAPLYFRIAVDLSVTSGQSTGGRQRFGSIERFPPGSAVWHTIHCG